MNKVKGKSYQNMFVDTSDLQEIFQFEDMPEASAETVGKIYQYLGETNANFTKGYFYIGIDTETVETETDEEDNEIEVTYHDYSFENINVQNDQTGSNDYSTLSNKPSINDVTLSGNKSSSDLGIQEIIQYSTMPTASSDTVGKIVQYTGTTDSTYTNGYFYIGIENSNVYSWENINVQAGSASNPETCIVYSYNFSQFNSLSTADKEKILALTTKTDDELKHYILVNTYNSASDYEKVFYFKSSDTSGVYFNSVNKKYDYGKVFNNKNSYIASINMNLNIYKAPLNTVEITQVGGYSSVGANYLATNENYSSPYIPTYDGSPATKKYVDDKLTTYSGYDASKTQILKNVNGTLTWVDE